MTKLTAKQQRFVEEYLVDLNATQAAIRAGYSKKTARLSGHRNITNDNIAAEIQAGRDKLSEMTGVTAERVIEELALVAFTNMQDYIQVNADGQPELDFSALTRDQAAALSEIITEEVWRGRGEDAKRMIRTKFKLHSKMSALDQLCKYFGLFVTNVNINARVGVTIKSELTDIERARGVGFIIAEAQRELAQTKH